MKGIKYQVTYVESVMDWMHGNSYRTEIIYIPELKVTINYLVIRKDDQDYTKPINKVIPKNLGEVEIDDKDIEKIKTIINTEKVKKELIKKYIGDKK